jgi:hypothetical protein
VRLHGFKYLHEILETVTNEANVTLTAPKLLDWLKKHDVLARTINASNHSEIITKGGKIITFLVDHDAFDFPQMEAIWRLSFKCDEATK